MITLTDYGINSEQVKFKFVCFHMRFYSESYSVLLKISRSQHILDVMIIKVLLKELMNFLFFILDLCLMIGGDKLKYKMIIEL